MSNLLARVLTAVVLVPVLIVAIEWHDPRGVWALVIVATAISLREWMTMTLGATSPAADRGFGVLVGTALAAALYWTGALPWVYPTALAGAALATFLWFLFRYGDMETVARRISFVVTGFIYCGLLTFLALLKDRGSDGAAWIYVSLTIAWLSDTGAYFAGRFLGPTFPRKLYEAVSPKKTVVGSLGGLAASYGALVVAKLWYLPSLTWVDTVLIAVPANLLGQMGDLAESLIKRSVGVKDSGALLPGHGGMLDRIDAVLFVCPYVFAYATWVFGRI